MPVFGVVKLHTELACLDSWTNLIRLCVCIYETCLYGKLVFTHTHICMHVYSSIIRVLLDQWTGSVLLFPFTFVCMFV